MNGIEATATMNDAWKLARLQTFRAVVQGVPSIVTATAWQPVIPIDERSYSITARAIEDVGQIEVDGTPTADAETQAIINGLRWQPWN